jgi:hypothetical protein
MLPIIPHNFKSSLIHGAVLIDLYSPSEYDSFPVLVADPAGLNSKLKLLVRRD